MPWWGKVFGSAFGFMLGGPLGALVGAALGHNFDAGLDKTDRLGLESDLNERERVQTAFFTATFSVMGRLAKVDGRVSEDEIKVANAIMDQMGLVPEQRRMAQRLFNEGKTPEFPLDDVLDQLRRECRRRHSLLRLFLEIQFQAAYADGVVHPDERQLLHHVAMALGFDQREFEVVEGRVKAEQHFRRGPDRNIRGLSLHDAYAVLGVRPDADADTVKKAYRRLMSQNHPDKLVSKGLPEEMLKVATEKTQEIKAAYETICQARGY